MEAERKMVVGARQLRKALDKGLVSQVLLARNADPAITEPIEELCRKNHVTCTWIGAKQELGRICGIEVGAAAAAYLKP